MHVPQVLFEEREHIRASRIVEFDPVASGHSIGANWIGWAAHRHAPAAFGGYAPSSTRMRLEVSSRFTPRHCGSPSGSCRVSQ